MMYTLCQRLIENPRIGFDYDYMGAAEYEFGATYQARKSLAQSNHERRACKVKGIYQTYFCTAIFSDDKMKDMREVMNALAAGKYRNKGAMDYSRQDQLGWLMLDPVPALIIINTPKNLERASKFLDHGSNLVRERETQ